MIIKYAETQPTQVGPGMSRRLAHSDHLMMVVIDLTDGPSQAVPLHQHPHEQISYLAAGQINFVIHQGDEVIVEALEPGDMVVVPSNAPHTVELLSTSARIVDCFYPLREDFL